MCLLLPPRRSSLPGNLRPLLLSKARSPGFAAHTPQRHGGCVLAIIRHLVLDLAGRDLGDQDRAGVYVRGTALAFGSLRHCHSVLLSAKLRKCTNWRGLEGGG